MSAALAMGAALGIEARAVAELLPAIETAFVRQTNQKMGEDGADG